MNYKELVMQMTLDEKASLMSGANFWNTKPVKRLGVPSMMLTDGPHGLRKQGGKEDHLGLHDSLPATCYPPAASLAASWDEKMLEQMGEHLGLEAVCERVGMVLGPGVNIKRSPLCGRNFEYFSEDPFLSGKCGAAVIRGVQSKGISACVKHFAANSQELFRMTSDSIVDERTLREIYLPAFETAVKEGKVKCVMTAYNRLNGAYCNENPHLLIDILRDAWGYNGMIVTDWGSNNDRVAGLAALCDLEMPSTRGETDRQIVRAVESGALPEAILDERVEKLLEMIYTTRKAFSNEAAFDKAEHHAFARQLAAECCVLLKNEDALLPLNTGKTVAVIGDFANKPRYQGSGSSRINPTFLDRGLDELKKCGLRVIGYEAGFRRSGSRSRRLLERACALARKAEVVVLWLGLDEGSEAEGVDRSSMRLPDNQVQLLRALRAVNPNIAVVLSCGSPVELDWDESCRALLYAGLGGQAGAGAVADILSGRVCPSGKLAESIPLSLSDTPCSAYFPGPEATAEYREGLYVGHRYYDTAGVPVKYPFGHGLSYSTFTYSALHVDGDTVSFTVTNTGMVYGAEIAQLYVAAMTKGVFRPAQELRGFARVSLMPEERKRVCIRLDDRAYSYWNVQTHAWEIEDGAYEIRVGASSRDIRLAALVQRRGTNAPNPYTSPELAPYYSGQVKNVSDETYASLLGHEPPERMWDRNAPLGFNSAIGQGVYLKRGLGRALYRFVRFVRALTWHIGMRVTSNNVLFAMNLPYRGLSRMTNLLSDEQVMALLLIVNREKGGWRSFLSARRIGQ